MDFPWLGLRKKTNLLWTPWNQTFIILLGRNPVGVKKYFFPLFARGLSTFLRWLNGISPTVPSMVGNIMVLQLCGLPSPIRWYAPRPHVDTLLGLAIGYESPVVNDEMTEIGLRKYTSYKIGLCFTLVFLFVSVPYNHILFICGCE